MREKNEGGPTFQSSLVDHFSDSNEATSVSIIGAGNSGCALAADLAKRGFRICLYAHPQHSQKLESISKRGCLPSNGSIEGAWNLDVVTKDMAEATGFSDYIVIALPSYAQDKIFDLMTPYLLNSHVVVNLNGNFGSFSLLNSLGRKSPTLIETNVAPHASRVSNDGNVTILAIKKFLSIASFPSRTPSVVRKKLAEILPCDLEWCDNLLEVALQSNNGVIHPAPSVLNTGWIEATGGNFYFYRDGISPAVGRVVNQVDQERVEIGKRYGFKLRSLLDEMKGFYGGDYETISDFAHGTELHNRIKEAPANLQHRYVTEDIPFALVPWYDLGRVVGFEAKAIKALIDIASIMNGVDYMKEGRNLEKMGLSNMRRGTILRYVQGDGRDGNNVSYDRRL